MPRKSKKAAPPADANKNFDEFPVDDGETVDDDSVTADAPDAASLSKSRDWRDVEKLQEERRLRRLIADDLDFGDLDERPRR